MSGHQQSQSKLRFYILFGVVSGALWAQLPILLTGESWLPFSLSEFTFTLFAGALTGIAVTCSLGPLLRNRALWVAICIGILALPVGSFLYGVIFTLSEIAIELYDGTFHLRSNSRTYYYGPVERGLIFIYGSCATVLAPLFFPLSVGTTLLLWKMNRKNPAVESAPLAAH